MQLGQMSDGLKYVLFGDVVAGRGRLVVILDGSICNVWEFVLVQTYSLVESY
jgi:hypothetical protein